MDDQRFATAVAMGAIIGRTAIAGSQSWAHRDRRQPVLGAPRSPAASLGRTAIARSQSYTTGAIATCTLAAVHRVANRGVPLNRLIP